MRDTSPISSLLVILLLVVGVAFSEPQQLDSETYASVTSTGKWLVEFYAPWCGHCQKLEPVWKELADKFEADNSEFQVAKVDCTVSKDVCESVDVKGFPTIKYVSGDIHVGYKGPRTLEDFVLFSQKVMREPLHTLASLDDLDALKANDNARFFLLVSDESTANSEDELFSKYAKQHVLDGACYSIPASASGGLAPGIHIYKDAEWTTYSSDKTSFDELSTWAKRAKFPRFFQLTRELASELDDDFVCLTLVDPSVDNSALFAVMNQAAATTRSDGSAWPIRIVWMDAAVEWKAFVSGRFHYHADDIPRVVVYNVRSASYYEHPTSTPTKESVIKLLDDVVAGRAEAKGGRGLLQDISNYFSWLWNMISESFAGAYAEYPQIIMLACASLTFCIVVFVRNARRTPAPRDKAE